MFEAPHTDLERHGAASPSVFKEKALSDIDLDPIYLNGYIALYQVAPPRPALTRL